MPEPTAPPPNPPKTKGDAVLLREYAAMVNGVSNWIARPARFALRQMADACDRAAVKEERPR